MNRRASRPGRRLSSALGRVAAVLGFLAAAAEGARGQETPYSVSIAPEPPRSGEIFAVTVLLPGIPPARISAKEPDRAAGMTFVSMAVSAAVQDDPDGSRTGSRVVYSFRADADGEARLPRLEISIPGSVLRLGPLTLDILPPGGAAPRAPYAWRAPAAVVRWQCFEASLESGGPSPPPAESFDPPSAPGLSLEPSGKGSFVGIALEEGDLRLPELRTPDGGSAAESRRLRSLPAPREIAESRAVGSFTVRVEHPARAEVRVGETLTLRVEVRGRGNLPILEPPELRIRGPGGSPGRILAAFPLADIRASSGAYEGMAGRALRFAPEEPGEYTVSAAPFAFLDPAAGRVRILRPAPFKIVAAPSLEGGLRSPSAGGLPAEGIPASYAARPGALGAASALALEGRTGEALQALEGAGGPEALHLKGILLMARGEGVPALAALGRAERQHRGLPDLTGALESCETAFGLGPHIRDRLPEPRIFLWTFVVLLAGSGALLGTARLRASGRRPKRRGAASAGLVLLAAAGSALLFAAGAALERGRVYAVIEGSDAFAVPSETGTRTASYRGRSGILSASSGDWALVRFGDGSSAWFRAGEYVRY